MKHEEPEQEQLITIVPINGIISRILHEWEQDVVKI